MNDLARTDARALEGIDTQAVVEILTDLLAVPSASGSHEESDVQHLLAARLRALDLDVDLWPALDLRQSGAIS
jgi:acetylornithine deacetylase